MSDLVGNPEDRFSHVAAQICLGNIDIGHMTDKKQKSLVCKHCIHWCLCNYTSPLSYRNAGKCRLEYFLINHWS